MVLLAVAAGHAVGPACDGHRDLRHDDLALHAVGVRDRLAHRADRPPDPPSNVARCRLHATQARDGGVELNREPGPIVLHQLKLGLEIAPPPLGLEPAMNGGFEKAERRVEARRRFVQRGSHAVPQITNGG